MTKYFLIFLCFSVSCIYLKAQKNAATVKYVKVPANFETSWMGFYLDVDPAKRYLTARAQTIINITENTRKIIYQFEKGLVVDSVVYKNQQLVFNHTNNGWLILNFPTNLKKQEQVAFTFYYKGAPSKKKNADNTFGYSFITTTHNNAPILFTINEPYGASSWYPCRNELNDKIDSVDFFIQHPTQFKASAIGEKVSETQNGEKTVSHFKHRYPVAPYLVAFAVSNYAFFEQPIVVNGKAIKLSHYCYPEQVDLFKAKADSLVIAMKLLSKVFGEYPFANEGYTQTQITGGGGMEHQGNSFLDVPDVSLMVHELAHQWLGDKVTHNSWSDLWLKEGAAVYTEAFLFPQLLGDTQTAHKNANEALQYLTSKPNGSLQIKDSLQVNALFDGRMSYVKGAFMYRMLQYTIGDSAFFAAMNNYVNYTSLAYGFASYKNLQMHMEATSKKDLSYFFKQWRDGEGCPMFTILYKQNNDSLLINVQQKTTHPSVPFFKTALPILLLGETQQQFIRLECAYNNQQTVINNIGFTVKKIIIDPQAWVVSTNNKVKKL
jgi:aminopeptidase N